MDGWTPTFIQIERDSPLKMSRPHLPFSPYLLSKGLGRGMWKNDILKKIRFFIFLLISAFFVLRF